MKVSEFSWQRDQAKKIYAQEWKPERGDISAVVVLVHGMGEHGGRYHHVAQAFTHAGIALLSFDLPGHGRSAGKRGDTSFDEVSAEIDHLLEECALRYPGKPRFLYGHSMGGEIALYHLLKNKPAVNGAVITSPGLAPGVPVAGYKVFFAKVLLRLMPSISMANGLEIANISRDAELVKAYIGDKLVHNQVSIRLGRDVLDKGPWIIDHAQELRVPLLLVQGTGDRIVSVKATCQFAERAPAGKLKLKLWEGLYHETHNEPEKQEVIAYTIDWLSQRLSELA